MELWNEGFPQSPEDRIGMLFWRMHRCARIIFSLNYHMGKWSPQQCIDFLVDRVGHERANAEGEVRRSLVGGYSPLYQVGYMLGGLQFMALKNEMTSENKMSLKQFHDAVLQQNSMPVEMLRNILTNQPLKEAYKTSWRFYDTIYTERFLKTPKENPGGYDDNSPLTHVDKLKGNYFLIHGTGDDNVHFQNAVVMEIAQIQAGKQFRSFYYPNRSHSISGGKTRLHLYTMMTDYLEKNL